MRPISRKVLPSGDPAAQIRIIYLLLYMVMKNHDYYTIEASTEYVYMVAALYDYYVTASDYYAYVNAN